ncbi:trypsin-like peptidase domain-containing protein [Coleofasciculus sp. H7-2]|uniref:trypsin-like peptidase domain-containing protein n=1 Tax=Coleofasciculus sp. H7-2 TaxID=3351545 RepID=UPI00366B2403
MSTKVLRIATSGIIAATAAIGANAIDAIAPFNWQQPNIAVAQDAEEQTNIQVYKRASPAVVSIQAGDGSGSGSIISRDGLVLTNAHVVANGRQTVTVILSDGRRLPADIVAFANNSLDLAVVKIRGQNNLPTVAIAPANSVQVGQRAFAIGNPFGRFQGTFTVGIVSRIDQQRGLIQTDAAINPGNSGGPLLNSQGELIGVNTAIFTSGQSAGNIGIGFAISVDRVQPFLTAVRQGRAPTTAQRQQPASGRQPPKSIALNGAVINATLSSGDNVLQADNSYFDLYTFQGRAGQRVKVDMASQQIDSYLILLGPNGNEVAQDDDGGGRGNASLVATLPASGTYLIIANSSEGRQAGAYRLRAMATAASDRYQTSQNRLLMRQAGILGRGAKVLSDGSLFQEYSFQGRAGQPVTIALASPDFDTYLILVDQNDRKIAENDNISRSNPNSQLSVTLPRTGVYRAIATASNPRGRGRYLLTIR